MAVALIASSRNTSTTTSVAYGVTPTAGNLLIFTAEAYDQSSTSVGISAGPSGFTQAQFQRNTTGATRGIAVLYWKIATGSDATPSITFTGSPAAQALQIEEWSGLAGASPVDVTMPGAVIAASGALSTGSQTTTFAADFLYALLGGASSVLPVFTWGSGFTSNNTFSSNLGRHATATQVVAATGSYAATCSIDQGLSGGFICVAFKLIPVPVIRTNPMPALVRAACF